MPEELTTRFAKELDTLMKTHDPPMSIRDLAGQLGLTYEFVRKLLRGYNLPTRSSRLLMSKTFDVDIDWLDEVVKEDKAAQMFGRDVASIMFNPETKALVTGMAMLSEQDRKEILALTEALLKSTSKKKKRT